MAEFLRAALMIVVLVGLPTAWIYYGPLPPNAQRVLDRVVELVREAAGWHQPATENLDANTAPQSGAPPFATAVSTVQGSSSPPLSSTNSELAEQLEPLLERLRALGPTEYALEAWGNGGEFFRFRCTMPIAKQAGFTRQFEAVAENPSDSIQQVIGEVMRWQTARLEKEQGAGSEARVF